MDVFKSVLLLIILLLNNTPVIMMNVIQRVNDKDVHNADMEWR